jgi:hypothetical protein
MRKGGNEQTLFIHPSIPAQKQFCLIYGYIQFSELCILSFINPPAALAVMVFGHNIS